MLHRVTVMVLLSALLAFAAPAFAGSVAPSKQCGQTIPDGSYKDSCHSINWASDSKLKMVCGDQPVNRAYMTVGCNFIKNCDWKLEYPYRGKIRCE